MLRAVNVGGTGKLPMADLKRMGEEAGFEAVRTYIASGNLLFRSSKGEATVRKLLEDALEVHAGKHVAVHVRTAEELEALCARNPFANQAPNRTVAILIDGPLGKEAITNISGQANEELALGDREIFVHYGDGMAHSRLRIPAAAQGTARNMNTMAKLAELTAAL